VVNALLDTTTQAGKNKALLLAAAHDSLAPLAGRLIAGGAEVDAARPSSGSTPLYIACDHGNVVMVARLIESTMRPLVAARRCSSQLRTIDWMF
jgi:ankyrin repeat protein